MTKFRLGFGQSPATRLKRAAGCGSMLAIGLAAMLAAALIGCERKTVTVAPARPAPEPAVAATPSRAETPPPSSSSSGATGERPTGVTSGNKTVHVSGYTRKDGKTVAAYDRAAPGQGTHAKKK